METAKVIENATPKSKKAKERTFSSVMSRFFAANKFNRHWNQRNKKEVIVPFVSALECTNTVFHKYVFVLDNDGSIEAKLKRLNFDRNSYMRGGNTYYNDKLNIAITMVENKKIWDNIQVAIKVANNYKYTDVSEEEELFATVFDVLEEKK